MKNNWPTKKLGEVLEKNGVIPAKIKRDEYQTSGKYPVVDQGENLIAGYIDDEQKLYRGDLPVVVFGDHTRILKYIDFPFAFGADGIKILRPQEMLLPKYFYYTLILNPIANQGYKRHFSLLAHTKILIPPLKIQKQIVGRLDKIAEAQKLNDDLIQKSDELFQSLLHQELNPIGKDWGIKKLGDVCEIARGGSPRPINQYLTNEPNGINWIKIGDAGEGEKYITSTEQKIKSEGISKTRLVKEGDFILSNSMSFGRPYILKISGAIHDGWLLVRIKNLRNLLQDFLYYILGTAQTKIQFEKAASGGVVRNLNSDLVRKVKIPIPPLEEQKQIVTKLSAVQDYKTQLLEQKSKLKELFNSALHKSMQG